MALVGLAFKSFFCLIRSVELRNGKSCRLRALRTLRMTYSEKVFLGSQRKREDSEARKNCKRHVDLRHSRNLQSPTEDLALAAPGGDVGKEECPGSVGILAVETAEVSLLLTLLPTGLDGLKAQGRGL